MKLKNKVRFCWWFGHRLYGNHYKIINYQEHTRVCHKSCADSIKNNREDMTSLRDDQY
jgi:hypothetical protein